MVCVSGQTKIFANYMARYSKNSFSGKKKIITERKEVYFSLRRVGKGMGGLYVSLLEPEKKRTKEKRVKQRPWRKCYLQHHMK